jgi:hypothetical protein
MQLMQHCSELLGPSSVLPELHLLRGAHHSADWDVSNQPSGVQKASAHRAGGMGEVGPLGGRNSPHGRWSIVYWPGKYDGVRGPDPDETPLSDEEVDHAILHHII